MKANSTESNTDLLDNDHQLPDERAGDSLLLDETSDVRPTLSVVLPTLDEEEGIADCLEQIKSAMAEMRILTEIIVVDSSTDSTPEIAKEHGAIVVEPKERGYGSAYKYGFEHVRGRYVVMGDADTTYDFTAIPRLLEPIVNGEADICMGSRLEGTIKSGSMPALHKYIGNPVLTRFLNAFYDAGVSDAHSGFRVLSRDALEQLELQSSGMEFASEMVMDASERGLRITEVPITYHERKGEETLDSFRDGWRHVKFMLVNAPSYLFSVPGTVTALAGIAIMVLSLFEVTIGGLVFGLQTMVGGSLLTVVGYQVTCFGLFTSVAADPIREPRGPITTWARENFQLEHGVGIGLAAFFPGTVMLLYLSMTGVLQGGVNLPSAMWTLVASTAILLGVQTVFSSFFMSILAEENSG